MSNNPKEIIIETDVLVIGGGMAGVFTSIKARDEGANVTLVDRGYVSRSGASSFNDGHITIFNEDWGHDLSTWMDETAKIGEYMNNPEWTEATLLDSKDRLQDLLDWGLNPPRTEDGGFVHPFHGVFSGRNKESKGIDTIWLDWGYKTMPILRKKVLSSGVNLIDRIMITDLIVQDDCVCGAVGFHTQTGDFYIFNAKATVICTGTSGFKGQPQPRFNRTSFDGEAMAYRAGAEISGMEFSVMSRWKPYVTERSPDEKRTPLKGRKVDDSYIKHSPWILSTTSPIKLAGNLVDAEGFGDGPFYSNSIMTIHDGKGPLLLDMEAVSQESIDHAAMLYPPRPGRFEAVGADPYKRALFSGSFTTAELFMGRHMGGSGGITSTGLDGGTTLPGLFGAGDAYHSAVSGSVYPSGGTGLRVAVTTGARAAHSAVKYACQKKNSVLDKRQIDSLKSDAFAPVDRVGGFDPDWVGDQVRNLIMPYYIFGVRHADRLKATLTLTDFLENHLVPRMKANDAHELTHAHEAKNRILAARMMLESALFRTESRGLHYREDYPRRDDENWFAHVTIKEKDGIMTLSKMPLDKWWPDIMSIPYYEKYPNRFRGE